ncbi:hypothetical protein BRCON_2513 [Candidatus Sumerlaea chitinivorans]|uniref:Uncharacterized protein n=1 Tax=Sumerlaea chitinivorans TaxID=2250252 RepID=A0A2Z4Y7R4_SUMC1|nr:hypothetical protein BRCON_2513 [Candidatus Sumerlaea chitinivorans]
MSILRGAASKWAKHLRNEARVMRLGDRWLGPSAFELDHGWWVGKVWES